MLTKINRVLNRISVPINIINIIVGIAIGVAHVYLPFTSLLGLVLGIFMAISGSVSMGISYWFTSKNSQINSVTSPERTSFLQDTRASKIFISVAIPMLLLNAASSFFGMYTGTLLLLAALNFAISPPVALAISVILSTLLATGTLINSWLQTHYIWETLKQSITPIPASQETLQPACRDISTQTENRKSRPAIRFSYSKRILTSPGSYYRSRLALPTLFKDDHKKRYSALIGPTINSKQQSKRR